MYPTQAERYYEILAYYLAHNTITYIMADKIEVPEKIEAPQKNKYHFLVGLMSLSVGGLIVLVLSGTTRQDTDIAEDQRSSAVVEASIAPISTIPDRFVHPRLVGLDTFTRPEGPWHVALQIGHLNTADAPDELSGIRNNTGAQYGNFTEVAIITEIADLIKTDLESNGMKVTILPVTIPPNFYADVFLALHADGSLETSSTGYKIATSRRDQTGKAQDLVETLEETYGEVTGLVKDPNISRNMTGYYAFNWRRYDHSIHPLAVSAIVEVGFVTNYRDRLFLTETPELAAKGITDGVKQFIAEELEV